MFNKESRIKKLCLNMFTGGAAQILTLILSFVSRTIFIQLLNNDYLSCNGLFSNILTILSFTELGIGSAIIYSLYKPLADNNEKKVSQLMKIMRQAYGYIFIIIMVLGIIIMPFLPYIINDIPGIKENIYFIYFLFLLNSAVSYLFGGYKRSILIADQKNYQVVIIQQVIKIAQILAQTILLILTRNYIIYLFVMIFCTIGTNILISGVVNKKYIYLREDVKEGIDKEEKKKIFNNIKSIAFYQFGSVILNGTDNIIISALIKTSYVGICSNYIMIINTVNSVINQACQGMIATLGNFNINASEKENEEVFNQLQLIFFWMISLCTIGLGAIIQPLISLWLGNTFLLDSSIVLGIIISFYFTNINLIPSTFRTSMGLFDKTKLSPILAAIINLILSIVLARRIGLAGIFFATSISRIFTYCIIDPYFIYRIGFCKSPKKYYYKFILQSILMISTYYIVTVINNYIMVVGLTGIFIKGSIAFFGVNMIYTIIFCRSRVFENIVKRFIKAR